MATAALHRHQLAWPTPAGWARLQRRDWDPASAACLAHWAAHGLPLVVTQQPRDAASTDSIALGLPAPNRWRRRRLALQVPRRELLYFGEFPCADQAAKLLTPAARADWAALYAALRACGVSARVHGSHGWQLLSGLAYLRPESDIDLAIAVTDVDQADAVVKRLQAFPREWPRLDGELVFGRGHAVAWREWPAWRAGRVKTVLVKHLAGSFLSPDPLGHDAPAAAEVLA